MSAQVIPLDAARHRRAEVHRIAEGMTRVARRRTDAVMMQDDAIASQDYITATLAQGVIDRADTELHALYLEGCGVLGREPDESA